MKPLLTGLFVLAPFALVGCTNSTQESSKATTPAAGEQLIEPVTVVANKPIVGEADNTFSLRVPSKSIAIAQGEDKAVLIGINKGENFREQVAVKMTELPTGVTLETANPIIEQGSTDVTLMLKAAGDATLGDFTFKVTGHAASSGADFSENINLTVFTSETKSTSTDKQEDIDVRKQENKERTDKPSKEISEESP